MRALRERGQLREVLSRYGNIAQERGPLWNDVEFVLEIARTYSLVGNDAKVEQYFLRCAQLNPRRAALYRCQIGWFFQRKKRWARALAWYDRALETFPSYHLCLFRKGYCLERLHRPRHAAAALEAATAAFDRAPADQRERSRGIQVQVLFHLARNLREIGETERAREALDRCGELDDALQEKVIKREHRLASYGETYLRDGNAEAAIEKLLEARDIDPNSAVIWERLGRAYQQAGRFEEAEQALVRATQLPKGAVALIALARLQMATKRWLDAARSLVDALRLHPQGEVQIRMELAELQLALGRTRSALADLERLAGGRVPPFSTLAVAVESRIASILLEHGMRTRALEHLRAALEADPDRAEIRARVEQLESAIAAGAKDEPRPLVDAELDPALASLLGDGREQRRPGQVVSYFPERGYGFIGYGEGKTVFFHVSQCEAGSSEGIGPGAAVSFVLGVNHRSGKEQAERIRLEPDARRVADAPSEHAADIPVPSPMWPTLRSPRQRTL